MSLGPVSATVVIALEPDLDAGPFQDILVTARLDVRRVGVARVPHAFRTDRER